MGELIELLDGFAKDDLPGVLDLLRFLNSKPDCGICIHTMGQFLYVNEAFKDILQHDERNITQYLFRNHAEPHVQIVAQKILSGSEKPYILGFFSSCKNKMTYLQIYPKTFHRYRIVLLEVIDEQAAQTELETELRRRSN